MKRRMNTVFFGICFMAALLAETYCFQVLKGDLVSTVGIGMVVLITGYLLMDSIRSRIKISSDNVKFYVDKTLSEETEKWGQRYNELLNVQKATYTAMKKNTIMLEQQMQELVHRLDSFESSNSIEQQRNFELQKRALEGQKNSLNKQIHYNKENTKQIIDTLLENRESTELKEQLTKILNLMEANNKLLKSNNSYIEQLRGNIDLTKKAGDSSNNTDNENSPEESEISSSEELASSNDISVTPLYDDPNKNLTLDEIASLFASAGR